MPIPGRYTPVLEPLVDLLNMALDWGSVDGSADGCYSHTPLSMSYPP